MAQPGVICHGVVEHHGFVSTSDLAANTAVLLMPSVSLQTQQVPLRLRGHPLRQPLLVRQVGLVANTASYRVSNKLPAPSWIVKHVVCKVMSPRQRSPALCQCRVEPCKVAQVAAALTQLIVESAGQLTDYAVHSGETLNAVWGVLAGLSGACVTFFTWFAVTYSYRMDKHMVVTEVVKNLKVSDIASATQAIEPQQETPISNMPPRAPLVQGRVLVRTLSAPSRGAHALHMIGSLQSSRGSSRRLLASSQSSSTLSSNSSAVQNPLLFLPGLLHATAKLHRTDSNIHDEPMSDPSKEMKHVAKQITLRCLRRWDGFMGIRASSDGLGRAYGIWRDKFDGVHYAVLLLAMSRLNQMLISATPEPSEFQICSIYECKMQSAATPTPMYMPLSVLSIPISLLVSQY